MMIKGLATIGAISAAAILAKRAHDERGRLEALEQDLESKRSEVLEHETLIIDTARGLNERGAKLASLEQGLEERLETLETREQSFRERLDNLETRERRAGAREKRLESNLEGLETRTREVELRERSAASREKAMNDKRLELEERERLIKNLERSLEVRALELETRENRRERLEGNGAPEDASAAPEGDSPAPEAPSKRASRPRKARAKMSAREKHDAEIAKRLEGLEPNSLEYRAIVDAAKLGKGKLKACTFDPDVDGISGKGKMGNGCAIHPYKQDRYKLQSERDPITGGPRPAVIRIRPEGPAANPESKRLEVLPVGALDHVFERAAAVEAERVEARKAERERAAAVEA
jgi:hypothetical protein